MKGKVLKMQGGLIIVYAENEVCPCEIKGNVKKLDKVFVGDDVEIIKDDFSQDKFVITQVYPRKNSLLRPPLANLDILFIVCSSIPKPDFMLIDKMIIYCSLNNIKPVLIINKSDLVNESELNIIKNQYEKVVNKILVVSGKTGDGVAELKEMLINKTSAFTGQSAVGKSTLINAISPELNLSTNNLSRKTERGKHTTRHNEIFVLEDNIYLADTPGFSMLSLKGVDYNNLHTFYPEFASFENECTFRGCTHINCNEKVCGVVKGVNEKKLNENRYFRYQKLYTQLKEEKEWMYD